jgi:hypothetical protein
MLISRHDRSYIVELEDGTRWRVWPGDIAATLQWLPTTQLQVMAIDHEFCSHVLINQSDGSKVGVIQADADWPAKQVQWRLKVSSPLRYVT